MDRPDLGLCFIRFLPVVCLITRCLLRFGYLWFSFFRPAGTRDAPRSAHNRVYVYLRLHPMKSRGHFSYLAVEGEPVHPDDPLTWATVHEQPAAFFFSSCFCSLLFLVYFSVSTTFTWLDLLAHWYQWSSHCHIHCAQARPLCRTDHTSEPATTADSSDVFFIIHIYLSLIHI